MKYFYHNGPILRIVYLTLDSDIYLEHYSTCAVSMWSWKTEIIFYMHVTLYIYIYIYIIISDSFLNGTVTALNLPPVLLLYWISASLFGHLLGVLNDWKFISLIKLVPKSFSLLRLEFLLVVLGYLSDITISSLSVSQLLMASKAVLNIQFLNKNVCMFFT